MLNNCLSELYFNIFDHAEANGVSFSYIHCDDEDVIHIAICDFGKGIASTMRRAFPDIKDDAEALAKALEKEYRQKPKIITRDSDWIMLFLASKMGLN